MFTFSIHDIIFVGMEQGKSRQLPALVLPTVCVSEECDRPSTSKAQNFEALMSVRSHHDIISPMPRTPITTNTTLFHRWYAYRDERTSSSSSDSGVASLQFSPPGVNLLGHPTSVPSTVMALSPPGLSPLHVYDSTFSTPTLSNSTNQGSRFTFDHVPFRRSSDEASKDEMTSAFDLPLSSGKDIEKLKDILKAVRKRDDDSVNKHPVLQRKESVIQSTRSMDSHLTVDRSESLPIPPRFVHQLSVSVPDNTLDKILNSQYLLYTSNRHSMLSPSLSSPLSSGESYRLGTSPNYLGVSPNSLETLSGNFVIEAQKSPSSISSDVIADDEDKKQYYCGICKKDFKRPDILSRHLRRHTGEKPFGCDACGRYFSRSDHLRTHRRTHTDEKPYQCTICPYAARRRDVLTRHMSTRHQTKAGLSIFQRHRDIRRCLSDSDEALCSSSSRPTHHSPSPSSPKRIRHTTEISPVKEKLEYRDRTLTEIIAPRDRHITETSQDEIPSLNEIEDDVIVDVCDLEEEDDYDEDDEEAEVEE